MKNLIEAHNLNFVRGGKHILDNVSVSIGQNDFVTIIGPNGSGKSTLVKILLGIARADNGSLEKREGLKVGYVPQRFVVINTMPLTVISFLKLGKKFEEEALKKILREVEIDFENKMLSQISGGEMQKVLLARALMDSPDMLILDEPAQNLDIGNQLKFYNLLDRIYKERGISVLMVSHDLHMVMATSKQVLCLFHHVCCSGTPQIVAKDPAFLNLFGTDMASQMALYQHSHHHHHHGDEACDKEHSHD